MGEYKLVPKSIVDELAQFIRQVDGDNKMGAGSLADKICERFRVDAPAVPVEPKEFSKGATHPVGDCGNFVSGIDHNNTLSNPSQWDHQIEVYGSTPEQAEALRDRVLGALEADSVQGEPVGWQFYQVGKWWHGDDLIKDHRKNTEEAGYLTRDVYAAPPPTEHKPCPDVTKLSREALGELIKGMAVSVDVSTGESDFGSRYFGVVDEVQWNANERHGMMLLVQEPEANFATPVSPDVAGLVEALEWLRGAINATPENDKDHVGTWISTKHPRIKQIDAILAAHLKQGGNP